MQQSNNRFLKSNGFQKNIFVKLPDVVSFQHGGVYNIPNIRLSQISNVRTPEMVLC